MISIWFWYDFDMPKFMIFLWFRSLSVFLIWFWYDFLMVLESLRFFDMILIWFSYGFGVSPFFWYDFLMVLEYLRFLDMIFLWFWGASVFLIWFRYCFRPATSPTPVAGPRPHLPPPPRRTPATPPTPVAGPTSHPVARQWNHWGTLWFQTLVSFWFFWISRHVAACYRPTEFSLNISFTISWVRLARRRRSFQCCCKLTEFRV